MALANTHPTTQTARRLPTPSAGQRPAEDFVRQYLNHLTERRRHERAGSTPGVGDKGGVDIEGRPVGSLRFRGGQTAANRALASFNPETARSQGDLVYPQTRRNGSALSPWIRHGLLSLRQVWDHLEQFAPEAAAPYRQNLLLTERRRHEYATVATTAKPITNPPAPRLVDRPDDSTDKSMGCLELIIDELEEDGWLPAEARAWLADHWVARNGKPWEVGERWYFASLLDGARAISRHEWMAVGRRAGQENIGLSRWEVEEKAPGLCAACDRVFSCPVESHRPPVAVPLPRRDDPGPRPDVGWQAGPNRAPTITDASLDGVWITAESMGDHDPALAAHPDLPAIFVFDEPLLARLRLSAKRLVFLAETLADLAQRREVEVWLGRPAEVLAERQVAVTFTPVPGWRRLANEIDAGIIHPWPWLVRPDAPGAGDALSRVHREPHGAAQDILGKCH